MKRFHINWFVRKSIESQLELTYRFTYVIINFHFLVLYLLFRVKIQSAFTIQIEPQLERVSVCDQLYGSIQSPAIWIFVSVGRYWISNLIATFNFANICIFVWWFKLNVIFYVFLYLVNCKWIISVKTIISGILWVNGHCLIDRSGYLCQNHRCLLSLWN